MKTNESGNGWRFWLALGLGVGAGVAAGLFLNSDKGRRMRKDAGDQLQRIGKEADAKIRHELEDLSAKANEVIDQTKAFAEKAKTTLREKIEHFSHS